jgi:hypothetical protein
MQDLSGLVFERLTVIEFDYLSSSKKYFWKCLCSCGKIVSYRGDALKSGRRKSCGCIKSPNDFEYRQRLQLRLLKYSKNNGSCLEWQKQCNPNGYGLIKFRKGTKNVPRAAWIAWNGDIPKGMYVLHKCDNRKCLNINHLFLGNHHDNMKDMISKNRQNKRPGELHHINIMKNEDIIEMRNLWDSGKETQTSLARKFKCSLTNAHNIVKRKSWKHI